MADTDRVTAYLAEVAELIAKRNELVPRLGDVPAPVEPFNAAQDKLAARTPRLAAALTRVLELASKWEQSAAEMREGVRTGDIGSDEAGRELTSAMHLEARAASLREAISAALLGEEADRHG